jgi:hypothetical protein
MDSSSEDPRKLSKEIVLEVMKLPSYANKL